MPPARLSTGVKTRSIASLCNSFGAADYCAHSFKKVDADYVCVCLQVAHMTKSEMHLHDLAFLGPGLLFLDQYFNSFIDEYLVLWIALVSTRTTPLKTF